MILKNILFINNLNAFNLIIIFKILIYSLISFMGFFIGFCNNKDNI
jgi:hypothetical protein